MGAKKLKILILGANGFVGRRVLKRLAVSDKYEILACSRGLDISPKTGYRFAQVDMADATMLQSILQDFLPNVIINAAALSVVDYCETHQQEAIALNTTAVKQLATWCEDHDCRLLHLSTDFVFDGKKSTLYVEEDETHAVNFYGTTKLWAEEAVKTLCKNYAILRIEVVYGKPMPGQHGNIVELVRQRLAQQQLFKAAADQWRTPTWVGDVVTAVETLVENPACGTYHVAGAEVLTIAELAKRVAQFFGFDDSLIEAQTTAGLAEATPRPRYTPLDCSKAHRDWGYNPTKLEVALQEWLEAND